MSSDDDEVGQPAPHRNPQASGLTTAGNEADVEDNVIVAQGPSPNDLIRKLRTKPIESAPINQSRIASAREDYKRNRAFMDPRNSWERLTTRPKSAIETMADTLSRPEGAVPPLSLPDWHCLSLDKKIPLIPAPQGLLYYSPGKILTKLHRKPKVYSVKDPYNRERVVGSPYTALHDPHCKSFIKRPQTRQLLINQGLINDKNEIMCSLREFNKFRDYLKTLYTDDLNSTMETADNLWRMEQEQLKSIQKYLSSLEGRDALRQKRINRVRWVKRQNLEYMRADLKRKQNQAEARLIAYYKERELMNTEKVLSGMEKRRLKKEKVQRVYEARRRKVLTALHESITKQVQSFHRRHQERLLLKQAQDHFLFEWMDAKINFSKERMDRNANINIAWHESLKEKANIRQRRMETARKNIPIIIERRKKHHEWLWTIVRKYFNIWLTKTRERMKAPHRDAQHESVFLRGASGTLDATLKYLRFQTGTEDRLDDFILNIMRLKEEIRRQLALEEEDESVDPREQAKIDKDVNNRVSMYNARSGRVSGGADSAGGDE